MQLDRIDRKIVAALMADATIPVARLAAAVGLSQTPCWKRVQKLRAAGIIRSSVALVDAARLGLGLTVFADVEAHEQSDDWHRAFVGCLKDVPEVMEAHRTAGDVDYVLRIVVRDLADFDRVRAAITDRVPLRRLVPRYALECVKLESVLPIDTRSA